DTALAGDVAKSLRMLVALRAEGVEPVLVIWALAKEIRALAEMSFRIAGGQTAARVTASVWPKKRQPLLASALERFPVKVWERLLMEAALIDRQVKGAR